MTKPKVYLTFTVGEVSERESGNKAVSERARDKIVQLKYLVSYK